MVVELSPRDRERKERGVHQTGTDMHSCWENNCICASIVQYSGGLIDKDGFQKSSLRDLDASV